MLVFGRDKLTVKSIRFATKGGHEDGQKIVMNARIHLFRLKKNPHQPLRLMRVLIGGPNHG